MATYVSLIQFTDQGIRNVKDTVKRGEATMAEAEKMGMKIIEELWTMGAYDVVALFEAPDDETMTAFACKVSSLGNVKTQTMRAFRKEEMEGILAKIKSAIVYVQACTSYQGSHYPDNLCRATDRYAKTESIRPNENSMLDAVLAKDF